VATATSATILVCEDDPGLRLLLRLAIEPRGHRVVEAGDGETGILLARIVKPNLVVVDMRLPNCSGIEVVRALRGEPGLETTPILMATGSAQPADHSAAEEAGVDAFVYKPFDVELLVDEIERLLKRGELENAALSIRRLH
jgi:two-component system chemotaxis response regulator CheY